MRLEHRRTARECDLALRAALADDEVPHWVPMECRDGPADGHTGLVPCPPPGYVLVRVPGSDGDVAEEPYMPEPSEREVTGLPIPERRYCTDRAWRAFMARAEAQPMVGYRWARDLL